MSVHEDIKRKFMVYSDVRVSHTGEVLDGLQLDGRQLSKLIDDLADLLEREYVKRWGDAEEAHAHTLRTGDRRGCIK